MQRCPRLLAGEGADALTSSAKCVGEKAAGFYGRLFIGAALCSRDVDHQKTIPAYPTTAYGSPERSADVA
jgi:hypothetical protein